MSINLPLLINGLENAIVPPSAHDGTSGHVSSDSGFLMVPGAGHFVPLDAPALVNEAIRSWLDLHTR